MHSPLSLCDRLGLQPSEYQYKILARYKACADALEVANIPLFRRLDVVSGDTFEGDRVVALCALWRLLDRKGASCVVIAPDETLGSDFMAFVQGVVKRGNNELSCIGSFPRWNVLKFGGVEGWEMRLLPSKQAIVRELAPRAYISIALGAGSSVPEYVDLMKALEEASSHPKNTLIRVW